MQRPLRLALLIALLLTIPISQAIAVEYTHVLFLPSVSRNTNPPVFDFKEINGLAIWADCGYWIDDAGEHHTETRFHVWNKTENTIRFTDHRSTYVYVATPGASWYEVSRFPEAPFTITISVVGGDSASLYVWCLPPTPEPTIVPLQPTSPPPPPPPTEAGPPPKSEPTAPPTDAPTPTVTPFPSVSPPPPKNEPTVASPPTPPTEVTSSPPAEPTMASSSVPPTEITSSSPVEPTTAPSP